MKDLQTYLSGFYGAEEYPALRVQIDSWSAVRPLAGLSVLDGTPVFRNTMTKYLALLAGGAELTVVLGDGIPHDPEIARLLPEFGIPVLSGEEARRREFDVVLDCAGVNTAVKSKYGYVELTRSGMYRRACSASPCSSVSVRGESSVACCFCRSSFSWCCRIHCRCCPTKYSICLFVARRGARTISPSGRSSSPRVFRLLRISL